MSTRGFLSGRDDGPGDSPLIPAREGDSALMAPRAGESTLTAETRRSYLMKVYLSTTNRVRVDE